MSHLFVFFLVAFYFNILHSRNIWMLADFRSKTAWHDVTKPHFLKNVWRISLKFCVRMPNWRWIRYQKFCADICPRFYVIEKVRQGGVFRPPPPANGGFRQELGHKTSFERSENGMERNWDIKKWAKSGSACKTMEYC